MAAIEYEMTWVRPGAPGVTRCEGSEYFTVYGEPLEMDELKKMAQRRVGKKMMFDDVSDIQIFNLREV